MKYIFSSFPSAQFLMDQTVETLKRFPFVLFGSALLAVLLILREQNILDTEFSVRLLPVAALSIEGFREIFAFNSVGTSKLSFRGRQLEAFVGTDQQLVLRFFGWTVRQKI